MSVSALVGYLFNYFGMLTQGYSDLDPALATIAFDPIVCGSIDSPNTRGVSRNCNT